MTDRRDDTSDALSEVRTVLSRAETAIADLERQKAQTGAVRGFWNHETGQHEEIPYEPDPEIDDMLAALRASAILLDPWRGKRKSQGQRSREWMAQRREEWETLSRESA